MSVGLHPGDRHYLDTSAEMPHGRSCTGIHILHPRGLGPKRCPLGDLASFKTKTKTEQKQKHKIPGSETKDPAIADQHFLCQFSETRFQQVTGRGPRHLHVQYAALQEGILEFRKSESFIMGHRPACRLLQRKNYLHLLGMFTMKTSLKGGSRMKGRQSLCSERAQGSRHPWRIISQCGGRGSQGM